MSGTPTPPLPLPDSSVIPSGGPQLPGGGCAVGSGSLPSSSGSDERNYATRRDGAVVVSVAQEVGPSRSEEVPSAIYDPDYERDKRRKHGLPTRSRKTSRGEIPYGKDAVVYIGEGSPDWSSDDGNERLYCGEEVGERIRASRRVVDWRKGNRVIRRYVGPQGVSDDVIQQPTVYTSDDQLQKVADALGIAEGDFYVGSWGKSVPSLLFSDGIGFVAYRSMFDEAGVRLPFPGLVMDILNLMNCAPSQLHLNGWRLIIAFVIHCRRLGLVGTARVFFYFYQAVCRRGGWAFVQVRSQRRAMIDNLPSHSKGWKNSYFRLVSSREVRPWWVRPEDDRPRFPLEWSEVVRGGQALQFDKLSSEEQLVITALSNAEPLCLSDLRGDPLSLCVILSSWCDGLF